MFNPRTKPTTVYNDRFEPWENPTWNDLITMPWDQMEYMWDYFNNITTWTNRIKPI